MENWRQFVNLSASFPILMKTLCCAISVEKQLGL